MREVDGGKDKEMRVKEGGIAAGTRAGVGEGGRGERMQGGREGLRASIDDSPRRRSLRWKGLR